MRLTNYVWLPLALILAGSVHAQGWIKYVNENDQFVVNFPGEPKLVETDYTTESDVTIPSRIYSVENGDSRYAITVVDYTVADQAHVLRCRRLNAELDLVSPNQCGGTGHMSDIRGSIAFEAWNIRRRKSGEITYDAYGHVDGVPGHQIQILHPDESRSFIGLYMHLNRLYVLEGTVPGDDPPPGLFQQSLGMLDELGRRVRYEYDADGNYGRIQTSYEYVGEEDPITGEPVSPSSQGSDGRIRNPGERTGTWMPEE
jgi:YD repeat-containing protein